MAVIVMTQNLYLGTDIDIVLSAPSPNELSARVAQAWSSILATRFPERAGALAERIAAVRPHLVGLQEVALFRIQSPGDFGAGNPTPAREVAFDYLSLLLSELKARGLAYRTVATCTGVDAELPSATGDDIRMTDRNAILARADVEISNAQARNFSVNLTVHVGGPKGLPLTILRGWASADATVSGRKFRFVNTHLERDAFPVIQMAQTDELLKTLDSVTFPVVLVGDFNSAADGSVTATYENLIGAGFTDVWGRRRAGFTCCQDSDLLNPTSRRNRRIDLILVRGGLAVTTARIVGGDPADRTPSGLWPSDHAGVVARLRLPPV